MKKFEINEKEIQNTLGLIRNGVYPDVKGLVYETVISILNNLPEIKEEKEGK